MKKRVLIGFFSLCFIILLGVGFVSADWFGDLFDFFDNDDSGITGGVIWHSNLCGSVSCNRLLRSFLVLMLI